LGDYVWVTQLQGVGRCACRAMTDGLSMRADRAYRVGVDALFVQQSECCAGKCAADLDVKRAELVERDPAVALCEIENASTQVLRIRVGQGGMQVRRRREARQCDV